MESVVVPLVVYTADGQRVIIGHAVVESDWSIQAVIENEWAKKTLATTNESMQFSVGPWLDDDIEVSWVPKKKEL